MAHILPDLHDVYVRTGCSLMVYIYYYYAPLYVCYFTVNIEIHDEATQQQTSATVFFVDNSESSTAHLYLVTICERYLLCHHNEVATQLPFNDQCRFIFPARCIHIT